MRGNGPVRSNYSMEPCFNVNFKSRFVRIFWVNWYSWVENMANTNLWQVRHDHVNECQSDVLNKYSLTNSKSILGCFSNRTGTPVDDGASKSKTGLTNGRAANWAPEVEFSPFAKSAYYWSDPLLRGQQTWAPRARVLNCSTNILFCKINLC